MVEFAFGMVILMILLAGIFDLGRALFTYMALRDAAQEGALYGSINPTSESAIKDRVRNTSSMVGDAITNSDIAVTFSGVPCMGNGVTVIVRLNNFKVTMPFLGTLVGTQTISMQAKATDTILRPTCP